MRTKCGSGLSTDRAIPMPVSGDTASDKPGYMRQEIDNRVEKGWANNLGQCNQNECHGPR